MPQIFADWQPLYAAHGVPTFPVRLDRDDDGEVIKKPAIRGYLKTGSMLSEQWVLKFPNIDAFGFVCGASNARTKLTTLDVDTTDERVLADAQNRHGPTPIIVRTASGKFHGWYRHNGEGRRIRPIPGLPIDILGSRGFCIAPPSRGPTGSYEIIQGKLDDLDRLPVMRNVPEIAPRKVTANPGDQLVLHGTRNAALFDACRKAACDCATEAELIAFAVAWNAQHCQPPDSLDKVMNTVNSVWKWETKRRTKASQGNLTMRLAREGEHVVGLYCVLRANNKPGNTFNVTNTMADAIGWRRQRFVEARKRLLDLGVLTLLRAAYKGAPAVYRWPS